MYSNDRLLTPTIEVFVRVKVGEATGPVEHGGVPRWSQLVSHHLPPLTSHGYAWVYNKCRPRWNDLRVHSQRLPAQLSAMPSDSPI
jgi:hypothetical protein